MTASPVAEAASLDDGVHILGRRWAYKYVVAVVYVTALFLDILDLTIVNVAIPTLGRDFATQNAEWIVLGYTLSLAIWIPVSGWLGDRFGTKRTFMFAFAAFVIGSALCGAAQSIEQLIAFRIVQGVGGGMLTPVGLAMLFRAFPPAERARASTYIMFPTLAAPALGPVLGGLLVTHASWRWIFMINIPIGLVGLAFGLKFLREHREPTAGRFDVPGFVLSGGALALVVYALSEGPTAGCDSPSAVATGVIGAICALALVRVELTVEQPMLDLRLLGDRLFRQCNIVSFLSTMGFLGLLFVMPLYLQLLRGQDALHSGLTTFPQAFGVLISSQFAGRLYARIGPRRLMSGGLFGASIVIMTFITLDQDTSLWSIRLMMFARGLCMGFAFVPMQAAAYTTIRPAD
ncbi:MAG: DHA2 family efflux MFS transporter permease subunit, partial [Actinobacteria bacterium]|nr:DHA2 family efflux MFS transporter permease subunit [Actinomycetota bacterium]